MGACSNDGIWLGYNLSLVLTSKTSLLEFFLRLTRSNSVNVSGKITFINNPIDRTELKLGFPVFDCLDPEDTWTVVVPPVPGL